MSSEKYRRVADFYNDKSIFLTGASGYLGSLILELLLRTCPGIVNIFILVRSKKGECPQKRLTTLFNKKIFCKVKELNPELLEKVVLISGDIRLPQLGISHEDLLRIQEEVSIVIHNAADLNFNRNLKDILISNCKSTDSIVSIAKSLKKIDILLYVSTIAAFSNLQDHYVEEKTYRFPHHCQRYLDELENDTDEGIEELANQIYPKWVNNYAFSKALSENILMDKGENIPIAIVRPPGIIMTHKHPIKGYMEKGSFLYEIFDVVLKGIAGPIYIQPNRNIIVLVPGDYVSAWIVLTGWAAGAKKLETPLVVNFLLKDVYHTAANILKYMRRLHSKHHIPNSVKHPRPYFTGNYYLYMLLAYLEYYVPGAMMDLLLRLKGNEPKYLRMLTRYGKVSLVIGKLQSMKWNHEAKNMKRIVMKLEPEDKELFPTDYSKVTTEELVNGLPEGFPGYDKIQEAPQDQLEFRFKMKCMITRIIKVLALGLFCFFLYTFYNMIKNILYYIS